MRSNAATAVVLRIQVFWGVSLHCLLNGYQCCKECDTIIFKVQTVKEILQYRITSQKTHILKCWKLLTWSDEVNSMYVCMYVCMYVYIYICIYILRCHYQYLHIDTVRCSDQWLHIYIVGCSDHCLYIYIIWCSDLYLYIYIIRCSGQYPYIYTIKCGDHYQYMRGSQQVSGLMT